MGADITCVTTVCGWWNYSSTSLNTMKLYTDRGNFKSLKVIAALEFTGLSYSLTECGLEGKVKTNMPMFTSGTLHDHTSSMCSIAVDLKQDFCLIYCITIWYEISFEEGCAIIDSSEKIRRRLNNSFLLKTLCNKVIPFFK